MKHWKSTRDDCLYHYAVDKYVHHFIYDINATRVNSNPFGEISVTSSDENCYNRKRKRLQRKHINPGDTASFIDYDESGGEDDYNFTTF